MLARWYSGKTEVGTKTRDLAYLGEEDVGLGIPGQSQLPKIETGICHTHL